MRPCGSVVNPLPVTSVVQHGSSCGTRGGAALLFDLARARVQVNEVHYTVLISKESKWRIAAQLFEDSQTQTLPIDAFLCAAAISAYQRGERWQTAVSKLGSYSINQVAYGATISACQQAGEWKVAHGLLRTMLRRQMESNEQIVSSLMPAAWTVCLTMMGIKVDPISASALISAIATENAWLQAMEQLILFRQHLVQLNVYSYNTAINACEPLDRWLVAGQVFQRIQSEFLEMNVVTFNSLISCYAQASLWLRCLDASLALRQHGLQPSEVSFASSCSGCEKGRHWPMALQLLTSWRSVYSYASVVSACEKCRQWQEAISLAQHAPTWPVKATATLMNAAVSACEKSAQWRSALAMSHELRCDLITWTALCTAAATTAWVVAVAVLTRMLHFGILPQQLAYDAAVNALGSQNWQSAMTCCRTQQLWRLEPLAASLSSCIAAAERQSAAT